MTEKRSNRSAPRCCGIGSIKGINVNLHWPGAQSRSPRTTKRRGVFSLRSRPLQVVAGVGALALTVSTLTATALLAGPAAPAQAAPGNPGTPTAGTTVFSEDFQNATVSPVQSLNQYTGASGQKYTANARWLDYCNGLIASAAQSTTDARGVQICRQESSGAPSQANWNSVQQLSQVLGLYQGQSAAASVNNFANSAYTSNEPQVGPNLVEFQTATNVPFTASNRFLAFSVDVAALNCTFPQAAHPVLQFQLLDQGGSATNAGSPIDACATGQAITAPALGNRPAQTANVGTYTSNGAVLFSGSSVGIRMINVGGESFGNDHSFDNIRILDVTPQLDKSFSPAVVPTGGTSTLTFTVTNTSELGSKAGWSFTDALPAGLTATGGAVGGTCDADTSARAGATSLAITDGNLAAGETSCTITVPVTATTAGSYTNGPDNVTTNGLNPPADTTVTFESPALTLVKRAGTPVDVNGDTITDAGDSIKYTFTVTNSGDVPVDAVAVNDPKAGAVTCEAATLAPGASTTCAADNPYTITAADAASGSVDNTATATGTSPTGGTVTSPPASTSTPAVTARPGLTVVKSADPSGPESFRPGQVITYHFTVTNTGNLPMNDITINEGDFTGTGDLSAIECPATSLAAGRDMVCDATYTLTAADVDAGSVRNSATATGNPPGDDTPPVTTPPSEITIPVPAQPGLSVVKSADVKEITKAGQKVTYSFKVTNTGNVTIRNVVVNDTDFSGTGELGEITCPETTLAAGAAETCTAEYTVTQADVNNSDSLTNTATAGGNPPTGDPIVSIPSSSNVPITRAPGLKIVKSSDAEAAKVGQTITYSFLVTNTGNVTVTNPRVDEGAFSGTGQLAPITYPATVTLQPGESVTYTTTYTVTQADVNSGKLSNTATATGDSPPGTSIPPTPPSTVVVVTDPKPALTVVKTADVTKITTVGQKVTYSFLVTNTGNVTVTDPTVEEGDFSGHGKLSSVTCPSDDVTLEPGDSEICTATYTVVAADLAAGSGKLTNTATVTGDLPGGGSLTSTPSTSTVVPDPPANPVVAGTTPRPGQLAFTGTELVGPGTGLALMLLALGGGLLIVRRRRQQGDETDNA
ncbi:DUF7507 domain-containing protein [Curtobacterium sp. L1-20]|uniref:DUF7507 domain-containing protein n=1 Tax=Curtobacterium sp. L1-20 TaxID=3138181 RepID=UPI003B51D50D